MSYNRKVLKDAIEKLDKPTKFSRPKNQWQDPGEITKIPGGSITMEGVSFPVYGVPNVGESQMMYPGQNYIFPHADYVNEFPMFSKGGQHGGLDRWFAEKWVDIKTGKACGRQEGESRKGYPACRPSRRVNEDTPKTASELSSAEKEKFKRSKTSSERINYQHRRKEDGGEITNNDMANKPNNPALWSRAKSLAKQKFDVYPSAYANGWAAKWYKSKGGTWRKAEYGMEVMGDGGTPDNPGFNALPESVQEKIIENMSFGGYMPELEEMARGGYTVTRSNDRKGKTHKVTGPDGTVKYFGDAKLGQHPKDPERKKAFYARHKKNLENNPFFRAFARATWQDGGQPMDSQSMTFYNKLKDYYTRPGATELEKAQYEGFMKLNQEHGFAPVGIKNRTIMGKRSMINPFNGRLNLVAQDNPQVGQIKPEAERLMDEYMMEYGHYQQYNQKPNESKLKKTGRFLGHMMTDFGNMFKNAKGMNLKEAYEQNYLTPGTTEYEAHRVIQPKLQQELDQYKDDAYSRLAMGGTMINDKTDYMYFQKGGQRSKNGWDASDNPGFNNAMQQEWLSRPATKAMFAAQAAAAAKKKQGHKSYTDADMAASLDAVMAQQNYGHYGFPFAPALNPMLPPTAQGLEYTTPDAYPFAHKYAEGGTNNPGFKALPDHVQHQILSNMGYGGYHVPYMEDGGEPNGEMALGQMASVADKMSKLLQFVKPTQNLDPWIASKLAVMDHSADAINDYLMYGPDAQEEKGLPNKKKGGSTFSGNMWYKMGGININPANKGKFTAAAKKAGMGVQEFASHVLANKDNYSSTTVKRANFAKNASKWKHQDGGPVVGQEIEVTPEELQMLKQGGYTFEII